MDHQQQSKRHPDAYWRSTLVFGLGFLIAVTGFGAGMLAERDLINDGSTSVTSNGGDAAGATNYDQVRDLVDDEYFGNPADPTAAAEFDKNVEYAAIQGMMSTLDDYSTFLIPAEQTVMREQLSGEYQGIGVWVDFPNGELTIISPMPGSPAEAAGLKAGDVILAAGGQPLTKTNEEDALNLVRGLEGTTVRLTIRRPGVEATFDIDVVRGRIPVQSVVYRPLTDVKLAYIQVTVFGDKTTAELDAALQKAVDEGATGIVLDLRNNGGGWVTSAQEMIGRFVAAERGPALYEDLNPDGSERTAEPIIEGDLKLFDIPLVVLVNEGTASASEIVAGALRDYERATIIGARTFGKGSVQRVHDFADGSSARITFAEWLTPNQHRIQGEGIQPDVLVATDAADPNFDIQLAKAIEYLTGVPVLANPVASPEATPTS